MLPKVVEGMPTTREPSWNSDDELVIWSDGKGWKQHTRETDTTSASQIKSEFNKTHSDRQTDRQKATTCNIPEDIRDWIMALA